MNKSSKMLASMLAVLLTGTMMVGCDSRRNPDGLDVEIDENKSQVYVSNYNGGYGDNWLRVLAADFESEYEEVSFEEGKMGVQVIIDNHKSPATVIPAMPNSRNMVYFGNTRYYDEAVQGFFADITDIVTEGGENSIASRMSAEQQAYYTACEGKYYVLPFSESTYGFTYDIDLFEDKQLFFAKDGAPTEEGWTGAYKYTATGSKSTGPDGMYGTYDDGLPATWEDMFVLFDRMVKRGVTPLTWTGEHYTFYLGKLLEAIAIAYEDEESELFFSFNGTATHLVDTITETDNLFDELTFKPATKITPENGYELYNSAGRYYALKVMEKILSNTSYYDFNNCFNNTVSHTDAQDNFLWGTYDNKPIAMLVEGSWWVNEATATFEEMEKYTMGKKDRRLALMPMPKVDGGKLGTSKNYNSQAFNACVNGNLSGAKLKLAKTFLKFAYTEKALQNYTIHTDTAIAMSYELTKEQYNSLSTFGKSVWDLHCGTAGTVQQCFITNADLVSKTTHLGFAGTFTSKVGGSVFNVPANCFRENLMSAKTYFSGIKANFSQSWWEVNILG